MNLNLMTESPISGTVKEAGEYKHAGRCPPDLEALAQRRLATGAFPNVEEVIRRALETLEAGENWTGDERRALDEKIDRALEQVASGQVYGPEAARRKLAALS
jgi:Arc/MetJ-type ribon-helix-helix transcriptional regulator